MEMACTLVAKATADADAYCTDGAVLTRNGFDTPSMCSCWPATTPIQQHRRRWTAMRLPRARQRTAATGETVIIDIFPRNRKTLYNGDCTRTVVHGDIPDAAATIHAIVQKPGQGDSRGAR